MNNMTYLLPVTCLYLVWSVDGDLRDKFPISCPSRACQDSAADNLAILGEGVEGSLVWTKERLLKAERRTAARGGN
jgi:hypothetical protein